MAACGMLAAVGWAAFLAGVGPGVWRDPSNTDLLLFSLTGALAGVPLLVGAALAHRRFLDRSARPVQCAP